MTKEKESIKFESCDNDGRDAYAIKFPKDYRDGVWSKEIGEMQEEILRKREVELNFDLSKCEWIDPLPLMSILLEIAYAQSSGTHVNVHLPRYGNGYEQYHRVLRFLDQEGFLTCLKELSKQSNGPEPYGKIEIKITDRNGELVAFEKDDIKNLSGKPAYEDATCIPIKFFNAKKIELEKFSYGAKVHLDDGAFLDDVVEALLNGVGIGLDSKIPFQEKEWFIYKLYLLLQETLRNIKEHAYPEKEEKQFFTIYTRYRIGGAYPMDKIRRKNYDDWREKERRSGAKNDSWLDERPGCLEVFVLDRGMGMVKSFNDPKINSFDKVMYATFFGGRSRKKDRKTPRGGLWLLHRLLRDTADYIGGFEDHIWFGRLAPIDRQTASDSKKYHDKIEAPKANMTGLAMHFWLSWKTVTGDEDNWGKFKEGKEVLERLKIGTDDRENIFEWSGKQTVIDERFNHDADAPYILNNSTPHINGEEVNWILWLVRPNRIKSDVVARLEEYMKKHAKENSILVIADIPYYEGRTYESALEDYNLRYKDVEGSLLEGAQWPEKIQKIILCTNRWRFITSSYWKEGIKHGFRMEKKDELEERDKSFTEDEKLKILRWLKYHDSSRLWESIKKDGSFVAEKILWGYDEEEEPGQKKYKYINGYLDFARSLRNPLCADIYRNTLTRIFGIVNPVGIEPLGLLAMTDFMDIQVNGVYDEKAEKGEKLVIGSVFVSGETWSAEVLNSLVVYFFVHGNTEGYENREKSPSALLFWLAPPVIAANDGKTDQDEQLMRIGKTEAIARGGWKSFEVPRFDKDKKCVGEMTPTMTYADWQGYYPNIVKIGHWAYQGQHDFLTLHIMNAVKAAFIRKNPLAQFLARGILAFLGMRKDDFEEGYTDLLELGMPEKSEGTQNRKIEYEKPGVLVYRSHPNTDMIIRSLLKTLKEGEEGPRAVANQRIFPIFPIHARWGGSTLLVPPLIREDIKNKLEELSSKSILIFDDAAVTGHTLHNLHAMLSTLGIEQLSISMMVIANRMRLPSDNVGTMQPKYYWRMDVPIMGKEENCPLCHSIEKAEKFVDSLASKGDRETMRSWIDQWKVASPIANWIEGIEPFPLSSLKMKKYCYRQTIGRFLVDDDPHGKIKLSHSTGVIIHASELHSMSGGNDYFLRKIEREEIKEPEVQIELIASQIFLFGDEFSTKIKIRVVQNLLSILVKSGEQLSRQEKYIGLVMLAMIFGVTALNNDQRKRIVNDDRFKGAALKSVPPLILAWMIDSKMLNREGYEEAYDIGNSKLHSKAALLRNLVLELFSYHGYRHSRAISRFIDSTGKSSKKEIENVLHSLQEVKFLVSEIEKFRLSRGGLRLQKGDWIGCSDQIEESLQQAEEEMLENNQKLKKDLEMYTGKVQQQVIEKIFYVINLFNRNYIKSTQPFLDEIKEMSKEHIEISDIGLHYGFRNEDQTVWIPWYFDIIESVKDIISNHHASVEPIPDPWATDSPETDRPKTANMWVAVSFHKDRVELKFANSSKDSAEKVEEEMIKPYKRARWSSIKEIGGKINVIPCPTKKEVIVVVLSIPYAVYLNSKEDVK
jgi:hypothetical protein